MNYDKYFREMGNAVVVSGFKGYAIFCLVRRTSATLLTLRLTVLGWMLGMILITFLSTKPIKLLDLLLITFFLVMHGVCLVLLQLLGTWTAMNRQGLIKSAPNWDTWRKWQEEKQKK